jgi:two-component system chemotaxis response regulator CheB
MSGTGRKVLLVDDDVELLEALALYLKADRDIYELVLARSGSEALEILASESMAIVVSDIMMQGISGLEVLADIRLRHPQTDVILITAHASPTLHEEVKKSGCLHLVEKPFDPEKLRRLIRRELTRREKGFIGTLRNIQLTDLIQMSCWSKLSTAIRVTQGSEQGLITIRDGQIVDAVCEQSVGEEAFYRILSWKSGSFETLAVSPVRKQTIDKSWEFLILQGVRLAEEQALSGVDEVPSDEGMAPPSPQQLGVRVLVVDDSPFMCRALSDLLAAGGDIAVVGKARNGAEALNKIEELNPDVITLDVNMPVMDGGTALKHIMIKRPCPVVIVSKVGAKGIDKVVDFLCLGAVDFFPKPSKGADMEAHQQDLIRKIKTGAVAKTENYKRVKTPRLVPDAGECGSTVAGCRSLVVIDSGPGGYGELVRIIPALPRALQACLVAVQEMSAEFLIPFSLYLRSRSEIAVAAPESNSPLRHGCCYVGSAPWNFKVVAREESYSLEVSHLNAEEASSGGIDPFLVSIAEEFPGRVLVVLLSGADIGSLDGLRRIKLKGGRIIAQSPGCSLIPQPLERVVQEKIVDLEAGSDEIVQHIISHVGGGS